MLGDVDNTYVKEKSKILESKKSKNFNLQDEHILETNSCLYIFVRAPLCANFLHRAVLSGVSSN